MARIRDIIQGKMPDTIGPEATVLEAARKMTAVKVGALAVIEKERLVGIFSERDLMTRVVAPGLDPAAVKVGSVMTQDLVVADADESADACLNRMKQLHVRHLPVVSDNKLVGMLSVRNLLMMVASAKDEELKWLTDYVYYTPGRP
ncbi:MAG TPA: CBS domain-containing protein [Candidatus Methylomirabilis sp.]|jgi:CBS domain-containing protein